MSKETYTCQTDLYMSLDSYVFRKRLPKKEQNMSKETSRTDLRPDEETHKCQRRPINVKRDLQVSKETYECQKRPPQQTYTNKQRPDKETYNFQKRPVNVERDIYISKETYKCQKRLAKTTDLPKRPILILHLQKRPIYVKRDLQNRPRTRNLMKRPTVYNGKPEVRSLESFFKG